ncbi:MAG: hypothetical protein ACLU0O_05835 [Collinsella sp.]
MLPYTPLQHLLLAAAASHDMHALVMTSGNLSEEPIETDDGLAWEHLVAPASPMRCSATTARFSRATTTRGTCGRRHRYTLCVARRICAATVVVAGAQRHRTLRARLRATAKATIAFTRGCERRAACFVSQHIGDVENGETFDAWNAARIRLEDLFDLTPAALACDLHPSYLSSQWAREQVRKCNLPLVRCSTIMRISQAQWPRPSPRASTTDARVLGIAFDGTGAGTDGTIWGGEFLVAGLADFDRAAHLRTWVLPGGAASVRDARRNAFALLSELGLLEHPGAAGLLGTLDEQTRSITATMIERNINSPRTSSMGRLFDAAAAVLGICGQATYEGEPAIELEAAAWRALGSKPVRLDGNHTGVFTSADDFPILDPQPLIEALLNGIEAGAPADRLALGFHIAITHATIHIACEICDREGIDTVALSGGVFMNRLLLQLLPTNSKTPVLPSCPPHCARQRRLHRLRSGGCRAARLAQIASQ